MGFAMTPQLRRKTYLTAIAIAALGWIWLLADVVAWAFQG
jgi:hypothetical protein